MVILSADDPDCWWLIFLSCCCLDEASCTGCYWWLGDAGSCIRVVPFVWVLTIRYSKAMAPHSSTLAWKIPWTVEPGGLQSMGSQRIGHDWVTELNWTQRKPLKSKIQHHPTTSSTLCRTPHLNNKQNKNTNPTISRQDYHLTQPCPSKEKQTNNNYNTKNLAQISPYTKLTQTNQSYTWPILGGQKPKGRNN